MSKAGGQQGGAIAVAAMRVAIVALLSGCPSAAAPPATPAVDPPRPVAPDPVDAVEQRAEADATPADAAPPGSAARVAAAVASLAAGDGPPIRVRLFLPDPERSADSAFDSELAAAAVAARGAAPRLARVDVTVGPFDEAAVVSMRGAGILPREGGDPDAVRALLVAYGDRVATIADLPQARGSAALQFVLALHRALRGPIRVGVIAPRGDARAAGALREVLRDFELAPVDSVPAGDLAAIVVLASPGGPMPAGVAETARRMLADGRGVVVIGGPTAVVPRNGALRQERSPSDPSAVLATAGLAFEAGIVLDPSCARVSVPAQVGRMFLSYPPMVRTRVVFPGGAGEAVAVLAFASAVRAEGARGEVVVLASSSDESWVEAGGVGLEPSRDWRPSGESAARPLVVSVAVPSAAGGRPGRFVVVPTARIVEPQHAALEGNAATLAALVAWAADVQAVFGVAADGP